MTGIIKNGIVHDNHDLKWTHIAEEKRHVTKEYFMAALAFFIMN
jgi:hypothetical protein